MPVTEILEEFCSSRATREVTSPPLCPDPQSERAVAEWIARNRPALVRCARAICGNQDEAEDLVQEALIIACRRWHSLRPDRPLRPYLRQVMVNLHITEHRHARWRHDVHGVEVDVPTEPSSWTTPSDNDTLAAALATLGPRQRAVVWLRYAEGRSIAETATALGCRPGTVASQAARAIARLRSELRRTMRDGAGRERSRQPVRAAFRSPAVVLEGPYDSRRKAIRPWPVPARRAQPGLAGKSR